MAENTIAETHQLKKELRSCKSKLKEAESFNERLRAAIEYDEPKGWKPQQIIESQYGWIYAWLYPLYGLIDNHLDKPLSPHKCSASMYSTIAVMRYSESIANASRNAWDVGIGSTRYSSSEKIVLLAVSSSWL